MLFEDERSILIGVICVLSALLLCACCLVCSCLCLVHCANTRRPASSGGYEPDEVALLPARHGGAFR